MTGGAYGSETVLAIAHRGGAALGPENTMPAFERARSLGYRYLETDVRTTVDGVCVAFHDRTLDRLAGQPGRVADLRWKDVRRLRVLGDHEVPRLEDLLTAWPDARWMLDVKQPAALPFLVRAVRATNAARRICLTGTWDRWLDRARLQIGTAASTALGWRGTSLLLAGRLRRHSSSFVHVPLVLGSRRVPTRRLVERARLHGLRVVVWGVERSDDVTRLLDDGVEGVITDHIDVLRATLIERGAWLPGTVTPLVRSAAALSRVPDLDPSPV